MLNIKWAILLICACLWALSYATKISYQSSGDDLSPWTIYSYEGQLGWARVSLSGPDPEKKFATTAKPALKTYVAQHATHWISYNFHSDAKHHIFYIQLK